MGEDGDGLDEGEVRDGAVAGDLADDAVWWGAVVWVLQKYMLE